MASFKFKYNASIVKSAIVFLFLLGNVQWTAAYTAVETDTIGSNRYRGVVVDSKSKDPLIFASISVNNTNISTVTNTSGEFLIKVPKRLHKETITVAFLGYTSKVIKLSDLTEKKNLIKLNTHIEELAEVNITVKDPLSLVNEMLRRKKQNYHEDFIHMTGFYRETIKKRKTYVSLSEAVVEINKQPYTNGRRDILEMYKSRKSTDYNKLDTLALKLKGGPFSTMYLDMMKYGLLEDDYAEKYDFKFEKSTKIDNRPIYVVSFKQKKHLKEPLYAGKFFIDAKSLALTSATFKMNLTNVEEATKLFVVKKPGNAKVTPIEADYRVDYRQKGDKWFYSYSRIQLGFKINWKKRWFNTVYHTTMEMATTDWKNLADRPVIKYKDRLKSSIIMADEASGFSDPEFWGEYNVIEPEKPIEAVIRKIQKQLRRI